jgi:hypothetical protein
VEAVQHFVNAREGVAVLDGLGVEGSVVYAETEGAIFFFDKEDGCAEGGDAGADVASLEEVGELAFELGEFVVGHGVDGAIGGC